MVISSVFGRSRRWSGSLFGVEKNAREKRIEIDGETVGNRGEFGYRGENGCQ